MSRSPKTLAILLGATLAAGCMGDPQLAATHAALEDHTVNPRAAEPLQTVPYVRWVNAPAGCEGQLDDVDSFRPTEDAAELVGAVSLDGVIVCVDSLPAIQAELSDQGREEEAEDLGDAFAAAMLSGGAENIAAGDPTPQPNSQADAGDPTPQPNSQADAGDPTPQPNSQAAGDPTPQPNSQAAGDPTPQPNSQAAGDPTPQPNSQAAGDPTPQPNSQAAGDPTPQPNRGVLDPTPQPNRQEQHRHAEQEHESL